MKRSIPVGSLAPEDRPVDPSAPSHTWEHQGRTITFSWIGDADVVATRVYALAFTPEGQMLLVGAGPGDTGYWLPGGGIEAGETPEAALARELMEEAAATLHTLKRLGMQRIDDPQKSPTYQAFYWCRVTLAAEFVPKTEVTERCLVAPEDFLDTLFWGRTDPKGAMLLEQALALNRQG